MSNGKINIYDYDILQMYFCMDYWVTDKICIRQPTVGEIVRFGEKRLYSAISYFIANPTSCRVMLWDNGVDWNKISDYELFLTFSDSIGKIDLSFIFGNTDFSNLQKFCDKNEDIILMNQETGVLINKNIYTKISNYLKIMFNIHPKSEKAKGKTTKEWIIEEERGKQENDSKQEKEKNSTMLPLISAMVNHPGFKYNRTQLEEVGIVEFMDSVNRLQIYENTTALMSGIYSGMIDTSKIDKNKELNWLRDIHNIC